jgi:hypothetical protein
VLIARRVPGLPVVVDPDGRGARLALRRFHPDLVLLDDGFQHRRLGRDLDVVLLDAVDPFGRYDVVPAGLMREPFNGLARADVFVVTHAPQAEELETLVAVLRRYNRDAPILRARHVSERLIPLTGGSVREPKPRQNVTMDPGSSNAVLRGERLYAFCGIGKPEGFLTTLQEAGAEIVGFQSFPDHHRYSASEIEAVAAAARTAGARLVLTTEKDAVRIAARRGSRRSSRSGSGCGSIPSPTCSSCPRSRPTERLRRLRAAGRSRGARPAGKRPSPFRHPRGPVEPRTTSEDGRGRTARRCEARARIPAPMTGPNATWILRHRLSGSRRREPPRFDAARRPVDRPGTEDRRLPTASDSLITCRSGSSARFSSRSGSFPDPPLPAIGAIIGALYGRIDRHRGASPEENLERRSARDDARGRGGSAGCSGTSGAPPSRS